MTAPLLDQVVRDRIRGDFDTTLIVEAASGTGKTSELVRRMVTALMAGRAHLDAMVAVTFTEAAAGELKLRLRGAIETARQDPATATEARERLTGALPQLEEARIGTIHSFCADILRGYPVQAQVDPLFEVASDDIADPLFERAFERWFEAQLGAPDEGVRRILRRPPRREWGRARGEGPRDVLRRAAWELIERRDFPSPWRRAEGFERDATIDGLLAEMSALSEAAASEDLRDYFTKSLAEIARFVREIARREAVQGRDYDGLEAALTSFSREKHWNWTGFRSSSDPGRAALRERRDALRERMKRFAADAGADLAPRLRDELWPVVEAYEGLKTRTGCLDFLDLLSRARDLVRTDRAVRESLQRRLTHIFVDEFQDTDPLQVEILLLLSADDPAQDDWRLVKPVPGKLFLVGDPKQSIYRFRRADVALYEAVKNQLAASGAAVLDLSVSFRSVPEIQSAVNAAFSTRMRGETPSQPRYVPLSPFRAAHETRPSVIALPAPRPYGDFGTIVKWKIESSLPDAVAAFVHWLVAESGWTVTEREHPDRPVPVRPRHVCLLFRRFRNFSTDVTYPYVKALEARRLPHLLVGGSSFHTREEIETLRNALAAIERPEDEMSVFATLRGPFFALGDGALLAYRERCASLHYFKEPPADLPPPLVEVADALSILRELHRGRNRRPFSDTIGLLLEATRAHAGLAIWPTGEQALANVSRLMDMARRAERHGSRSFRVFVEYLAEQAERGEASDAPIVEEGTEGVRIMTVHRAKGLEFPVVVLADRSARETPQEPSRWVDSERGICAMRLAGSLPPELLEHAEEEIEKEREEAARVLYVAATRARDVLVVTAVGDERHDGWLSALDPAIYPHPARAGGPVAAPPRCPPFGNDSVVDRPQDVPRPTASVTPGWHRPEAGDHRVAWWDPNALNLGVEESVGLRQQKLLETDERGIRSDEGNRAHDAWQSARSQVRESARRPSVSVATATELAAADLEPSASMTAAAAAITIESTGDSPARPHGRRYGTLVHAVLASVDLDASRSEVSKTADLQGRMLGSTKEEVSAAVESVVRVLAVPLIRRAAEAARGGRCRRETPVSLTREDGSLVEGVVDVAFFEPGEGWTVIDFKTDVELEGRIDEYRRQTAFYVAAVEKAARARARGVIVRV